MRRAVMILVLVTAGSGWPACGPLTPPARVVPEFDALAGEPAPGSSRVVLDVEGRRCRVHLANRRLVGRFLVEQARDRRRRFVLCVTPCQVELALGAHRLRFCDEANVTVWVGSRMTIFRVAVDGSRTPAYVQWAPEKRPARAR